MRYIGDLHGKLDLYGAALAGIDASIQIGDFGFGFVDVEPWPTGNHRFIRGNHDDPALARAHPQHIESGPEDDKFFVGGGWSIDVDERTPGVSWWPDEEHSTAELDALTLEYARSNPTHMITHEAPSGIIPEFFETRLPGGPSRTALALQDMLDIWTPDVWIFGHWHSRRDKIFDGCRFICLEEGGWIDI
jgi:predicted phosphodiesterase